MINKRWFLSLRNEPNKLKRDYNLASSCVFMNRSLQYSSEEFGSIAVEIMELLIINYGAREFPAVRGTLYPLSLVYNDQNLCLKLKCII